ncbi:MAG: hypothetical protein K6G84_10245 [Lachnospiraceae bacterium]|nr:hypothetical protein [Lachnospiraceae bacterium]
MINKKVMALLLSAAMAFTASVSVLADNEVAAVEAEDSISNEVIDEEAATGSCRMRFSLDAKGDYAKTGNKTAYYQNADGTYDIIELNAISFSENAFNAYDSYMDNVSASDAEVSYNLKQSKWSDSDVAYYGFPTPIIRGGKAVYDSGYNYCVGDNYISGWVNKKYIEGEDVTRTLRELGLSYSISENHSYGGSSLLRTDTEEDINFDKLGQQDYYLVLCPIEQYSVNFYIADEAGEEEDESPICAYIENADGTYTRKALDIKFADSKGEEYDYSRNFRADASNKFTVTAPSLIIDGYEVVKWVDEGKIYSKIYDEVYDRDFYPDVKCGEAVTFEKPEGIRKYVYYMPIIKPASAAAQSSNDKIVEKTVSVNAGNHTIALKMNEAPAYTGGKLRAIDFISSFKIDGKEYPAKDIKIKVEGDKKVGSKVKVTIKKIKGADKQTNKDVKGTVLGEVTIRPIDVSEVTTWNKTFTKEGQIVVKTNKNGDVKSVAAVVSKKGVNSGDNKAKKLKVKKGTYTYDSAKKTITFNDGAICKGSVTIK